MRSSFTAVPHPSEAIIELQAAAARRLHNFRVTIPRMSQES